MSEFLSSDRLADMTMYDQDGEKVGRVGQVYTGGPSGQAEWITAITGLLGTKETLVRMRWSVLSGCGKSWLPSTSPRPSRSVTRKCG